MNLFGKGSNQSALLKKIAQRNSKLEYLNCNFCGKDCPTLILKKFDLFIVKCNHCSLVYANPRLIPSILLTRHSEDYLTREYLPSLGISAENVNLAPFRLRYQSLLDFLARYKKNSNLLDVGSGPGLFVKVAAERGWTAKGIDISSSAVEFGTKHLGIDLSCGSLEGMGFGENSFDAILFQDVIEHLFDPMATLHEAYRVLRWGGAIFISTPNLQSLMRLMIGKQWAILSPAEHLYYFTHDTLSEMLKKVGFSRIFLSDVFLSLTPSHSHSPQAPRTKMANLLIKRFINPERLHLLWEMGMNDSLNVIAEK
jgi:2-polyprenyl-3-methyl-5-hydroxy-6-metoxy-1,4-benzoquinol methylase